MPGVVRADRSDRQQRTPRRRELERKQQLDVERWLKEKFREGFFTMRKEFEEKDTEKKGVVSTASFTLFSFCVVSLT